jgi:hypothetical protein
MIGDEVQASKAENLEGHEDGGSQNPTREAMGNSNEPKQIVSLRIVRLDVSETKAIRSSGQWTHDAFPIDGAKLLVL